MPSSSSRWILIAMASGIASLVFGGCSSSSTNDSGGNGGTSAVGGAAGVGTGGGGVGGTAGTGGIAGAGGTAAAGGSAGVGPEPQVCTLTCAADGDCEVFFGESKYEIGLTCDPVTLSCTSCTSPADCVPLLSRWVFPCNNDGACTQFATGGQTLVCIEVDGVGRCAEPTPTVGCGKPDPISGDYLPPESVSKNPIAGGTPVFVCAHETSADCQNGQCAINCSTGSIKGNAFCNHYAKDASVCNLSTGQCGCATNTDCVGSPRGSECVAGRCGCATSTDCGDAALGKQCVKGYCSCSSGSDCAGIKKDGFNDLAPACIPLP